MHPMLNIAVRAARTAGKVIVRSMEQLDKVEIQSKGTNDFVTSVDINSEEAIIETIRKSYPDHTIVGEESGVLKGSDDDYQWIIDPLDGTANFIKGIPHFSISIALKVKGKIEQAVIFDPIRGELFSASRGKGAQLNGFRIRVSKNKDISGTIIATGFPVKHKQHSPAYMAMFSALFQKTSDLRRAGSTSLDLAYVAAGRVDGFFEIGTKPWNSAAGELLVVEAGGLVTDFTGGHNHTNSGNIVAANTRILKDVLKEIRPHLGDALSK